MVKQTFQDFFEEYKSRLIDKNVLRGYINQRKEE
jgi:hypothetical protein